MLIRPNKFFLSACNPLMTADQRELESKALEVARAPAVREAAEVARARWKTIVQSLRPDAEAWSRFDAFLEEFVHHYTLKALNSDPNYPRVVRYNMLSHSWFGHTMPGTRQGGGDNMDNVYGLIPVEHGARYEISVQRFEPRPADVTWSLMGNLMPTMTLAILEGRQMVAGPDGRFTVTVDASPADGRVNHIQTQPDTRYLFLRETLSDWRQVPAAIRAKRITKPRMPRLNDAQLVVRAARYIVEEIANTYWWTAIMSEKALNAMSEPAGITNLGGLVTQQVSFGRAHLADDEALVITAGSGGAAYHSFAVYDFWFNTVDYARHTSSMNSSQGMANADGTTTYVVSIRDPGVHNWIDPDGLHSLFMVHRWQGLPANAATSMSCRAVKLGDLSAALPPDMGRITPEDRGRQLERRGSEHSLRFRQE